MKKIIPIIILLIIIGIISSIFYFNAVILPAKLQEIFNEKGQEFLSRKITFDTIEYAFGTGIRITNLKIAQKDQADQILFSAKEISSRIPIIPLIKEKKIILPEITIKGFSANFTRIQDNKWSFSDLFTIHAPSSTKKPFKILLGKILLNQGEISISDQDEKFEDTIISITKIAASLSLPQKIHLIIDAEIKNSSTSLNLEGNYHLADQSIDLTAKIENLNIIKTILPLTSITLPLEKFFIKKADIKVSYSSETTECQGDITAELKAKADNFTFQGELQSNKTQFSIGKDHIYLDIDSLSTENANIVFKKNNTFTGSLNIKKIQLTKEENKFTITADISAIPSSLKFKNATINAKELSFNTFSFEQTSDEDPFDGIDDAQTIIKAQIIASLLSINVNDTLINGDLSAPNVELTINKEGSYTRLPFSLTNAIISKKDSFEIKGNLTTETMGISHNKEFLTIAGMMNSDLIEFKLPQNRNGQVVPTVSFRIIKDLNKLSDWTYSIKTELKKGYVENPSSQIKKITDIRGNIDVINKNITFHDLLINIDDTTIGINGNLRTFSKLIANLEIEARNITIENWSDYLKPHLEPYGLNISGKTDITLRVQGPLINTKEKPHFTIKAKIKTADINSTKYPYTFNNVRGLLKYKENFLTWENLKFEFQKNNYTSSGSLKNFTSPIINLKLQRRNLFISINAKKIGDTYEISRAKIKTHRSTLNAKGRITPNKKDFYASIQAEGQLTISDLKEIPILKSKISEYDIRGNGAINIIYNGSLRNPQHARYSLTYQTKYTSVKDFKFDNAILQFDQPDPKENTFSLVSNFYDGKISITGNLRTEKNFPFKMKMIGFDINVSKLKANLPIKEQQDIRGTLAGNIFLEGPIKKIQDITGQGKIEIRKGYFSKPNFLKGILGTILNPNYQDIVFTDAKAKIFIRDNKLKLMDIFLTSKAVDLTGYGWIDINKNIDFTISPSFKDSLYIKSSHLKSSTEDLLEKYISVHVTGKIGNPKYSSNITPGNIIEDAADILSEGIQGIMKGLGL